MHRVLTDPQGITEAGREEVVEWLSDLLAVPTQEYSMLETLDFRRAEQSCRDPAPLP
ncbi:hypothetical protein AB0J38_15765 [Streptomyces sp. NPDC050095]|uniref:hypothetical protein n=1 Tax=unclassified Streptomyces TaxID=2593676 RepID=UPI003441CD5D